MSLSIPRGLVPGLSHRYQNPRMLKSLIKYGTVFAYKLHISSPHTLKHFEITYIVVVQSLNCVWFCYPMDCSTLPWPSLFGICSNSCPWSQWSHPTVSPSVVPSPVACNLSQYQSLFQWVSSSQQVAKVLELQLQHQSFHWIFRVD